ncbi:hypothetical protein D9757_004537 [Collybiopsis confluens]|uniref:Uncharacterized protein n=1 Tax=Collybiopsis confluens TaxID=2823264 RepID=A0A8H5HWF7_9AGAR|nr:hypothetical protein D9757_004537 [Collybiopsis confluens]
MATQLGYICGYTISYPLGFEYVFEPRLRSFISHCPPPKPPAMIELPHRRSASPYGLAHPNYAIFEDPDSKIVHDFRSSPQHPQHLDHDTIARSGIQEGYMQILSLLLLAVLMACMNHIVFTRLSGKEPGSHTSQFWVTVLKNVFPAAVAFLLFIGLKICLSQVALYRIRLDSYPIGVVNSMTSPPSLLNTFSALSKSSMRASIVSFALLTAITQAVALTSLFVPGTLSVVPSPVRTQMIQVPTIDFNFVNSTQSVIRTSRTTQSLNGVSAQEISILPSQRWTQLIHRSASSNSAPGWDPPAACGTACTYAFSYLAPALNCTQLSKDDIWPGGTNISDSCLAFGPEIYSFYNSTSPGRGTSTSTTDTALAFNLDQEATYMENFNSTMEITNLLMSGPIDPQQWTPAGAHCSYQYATYEATTTFSNNTQLSSTSVKEWHNPITFSFNDTNLGMALFSISNALAWILDGFTYYDPSSLLINGTGRAISETALFNLIGYCASEDDPDSAFSELLGNITLAFVNEQMATASVEASVLPNSTQYQYVGWRLGLIYGIVFGFSLIVISYGLFCLQKNRTVAVFDLQHILEMTATSNRLHESAARPTFSSTLVSGTFTSESDGSQRRIVLEVSDYSRIELGGILLRGTSHH